MTLEELQGTGPCPVMPEMPMAESYGLEDLVQEMRRVSARTRAPAEILRHLTAPARRLALEPGWLAPELLDCDPATGLGIHALHEEADHSLSVVVAGLLPGRDLPPHNHKTWALQVGIASEAVNVTWRRTDAGSRPGYAEIEEKARRTFGPGDVLVFLPEDIHSIVNASDRPALSLNLYGVSYAAAHSEKFDPLAHKVEPLLAR
jgi:predicted metal-dependent enzyme (double-stranded beta helix superfamily)